jgi:hypothetical protein
VNLIISSHLIKEEGNIREDDVEHEISGQSTLSDALGYWLPSDLLTRHLSIEDSRKASVYSQHDRTGECTDDQYFSSGHSIGECDSRHGSNTRYDRVEEIVCELLRDT